MLAIAVPSMGNFDFILSITAGHTEQNSGFNSLGLTMRKKTLTFIAFFLFHLADSHCIENILGD